MAGCSRQFAYTILYLPSLSRQIFMWISKYAARRLNPRASVPPQAGRMSAMGRYEEVQVEMSTFRRLQLQRTKHASVALFFHHIIPPCKSRGTKSPGTPNSAHLLSYLAYYPTVSFYIGTQYQEAMTRPTYLIRKPVILPISIGYSNSFPKFYTKTFPSPDGKYIAVQTLIEPTLGCSQIYLTNPEGGLRSTVQPGAFKTWLTDSTGVELSQNIACMPYFRIGAKSFLMIDGSYSAPEDIPESHWVGEN